MWSHFEVKSRWAWTKSKTVRVRRGERAHAPKRTITFGTICPYGLFENYLRRKHVFEHLNKVYENLIIFGFKDVILEPLKVFVKNW